MVLSKPLRVSGPADSSVTISKSMTLCEALGEKQGCQRFLCLDPLGKFVLALCNKRRVTIAGPSKHVVSCVDMAKVDSEDAPARTLIARVQMLSVSWICVLVTKVAALV